MAGNVTIEDRWHYRYPPDGAPKCPKHPKLTPTKDHGRGMRWRVRWKDPDGRAKTESFVRYGEADEYRKKVEADLLRDEYVDRDAGRVTFKAYATEWLVNKRQLRPASRDRFEYGLRLHVFPALGDKPMRSIRPSTIDSWLRDREAVLAASTLRQIYEGMVKQIFRTAVRDKVITASPCTDVSAPSGKSAAVTIPTEAQVAAITAALPERYRIVAILAAGTGLRQGEIFGLELGASCLDMLRDVIHVRQQLAATKDHPRPHLARLKSGASYRDVPLPGYVKAALAAHLKVYPPAAVELDDLTDNPGKPVRRKVWLLFSAVRIDNDGATPIQVPMQRGPWAKIWAPARTAGGLAAGSGLHTLRHFYASLLIEHGRSPVQVQKLLGHADAATTLRTYVKPWEDADEKSREVVDDVLSRVYRQRTDDERIGRSSRSEG